MSNPQKELFKLLAESRSRTVAQRKLHKDAVDNIPRRQQFLLMRMQALDAEINAAGIGKLPDSEREYLQLLDDFHHLDQSFDLAKIAGRRDEQGMRLGKAAKLSPADKQAIQFGRLLLSAYGQGNLSKSATLATEDIQRWCDRLSQMDSAEAQQLSEELRACLTNSTPLSVRSQPTKS